MFDENNEIPILLLDSGIGELCESLIAEPITEIEHHLMRYSNVEYLFIPDTNTLLLEVEGEQRREHKRKHYSIEIGPRCISNFSDYAPLL